MYKPKGNCLNLPTLDFSEKTNVFWHRINLPDICLTGAELKKYVSGLGVGQEKLFNDNFSRYRWGKIRHKLGLDDFKFHDLRKYAELGINERPLVLCLLRMVYPQLSHRSCWSTLPHI